MKKQNETVLIIEDNANDLELLVQAFRSQGLTGPIHTLENGADAIAYLRGEKEFADRDRYQFPTMIITDLNMPGMDGFDVLVFLKNDPELSVIRVIMISGSGDTDDIKQAYLLGASSYFTKPAGYEELKALVRRVHEYWKYADVPQVSASGRMLPTEGKGKIGQRFGPTAR